MRTFTRLPRIQLLIGTAVVIVIASLFANVVNVTADDDGGASLGGWIGLSVFGIAVTAVLVLVAVPRIPAESRRMAVLAFGIGAVVTVVAFWTMLPFALAAAALAAAHPGDDHAEGEAPAPATAGVLLALLAFVAAFVFCVIG